MRLSSGHDSVVGNAGGCCAGRLLFIVNGCFEAKSDKACNLVFPTSGCNVKMNFLDDLKAVAERAELNPEDFWLHKFRATFATRCLMGRGRSSHGAAVARPF